jgi:hypothetical protein
MKPVHIVLFEALIVGALLILFYMAALKVVKSPLHAVFLSGAAFHLACEYTGVNAWYAKNYFKV